MSASGKRALVCYTSSERPPLRGWTGWMTKQPFKNLSEDLSPRRGSFVAKLFGKWKVSVQLQIFRSLLASIWNLQSLVFLTLFFFFFFFCSTFFLWKRLLVSCTGGMVVANGVFNLPGYGKRGNTSSFLCLPCPYSEWGTWRQTWTWSTTQTWNVNDFQHNLVISCPYNFKLTGIGAVTAISSCTFVGDVSMQAPVNFCIVTRSSGTGRAHFT